MAFHFMVRLEPLPGKADELREELSRVAGPTSAEKGCLKMRVFESVRALAVFAIHSEWVDEAEFDLHATLAHTVRFVEAAERLTGQPVQGLRSREIADTWNIKTNLSRSGGL